MLKESTLVLSNNIIIEFQHSQISNEDFNARNKFYTELGFNLICTPAFYDVTIEGKEKTAIKLLVESK